MSISIGIHEVTFWTNKEFIIEIQFIGDLKFSKQGSFSLTGGYQFFGQTCHLASTIKMETVYTSKTSVTIYCTN